MSAAPTGHAPTEVSVGFANGPTPELEVAYEGTFPPQSLFDALEASGWEHPVPVPPPAAAIDWSTPDPIKGTRYTVRPYRAVSRVALLGPDRSGRAVELAMATAAAHGALVPDEHRSAAPTPEGVGTGEPAASTVTVVLAAGRVDETLATLGTSVVLVDRHPTTVRRTHSYRGRRVDTEVEASELVMRVRPDRLGEVLGELSRVASVAPTVTAE